TPPFRESRSRWHTGVETQMPSSAPEPKTSGPIDIGLGVKVDAPDRPMSGKELLLAVEDLYNRLAARTFQLNPFWRAMVDSPEDVPERVFFGMCIENYHLLFRESYFDAPVLSYPGSRTARRLINEFYCEEFGHDELLLQALTSIGLSRDALYASVPLAETMAL